MAEIYLNQEMYGGEITVHTGTYGHIVIHINDDGFILLSLMEAKNLISSLKKEIDNYISEIADA